MPSAEIQTGCPDFIDSHPLVSVPGVARKPLSATSTERNRTRIKGRLQSLLNSSADSAEPDSGSPRRFATNKPTIFSNSIASYDPAKTNGQPLPVSCDMRSRATAEKIISLPAVYPAPTTECPMSAHSCFRLCREPAGNCVASLTRRKFTHGAEFQLPQRQV